MFLLSKPDSSHLLDISLEELHKESREWLNEILYWSDEAEFLYKIIGNKKCVVVPLQTQNAIWHTERELAKISNHELFDLQAEVELHENSLSKLMKNGGADEEKYRDFHKELKGKVGKFKSDFILLKKGIFNLIESISTQAHLSCETMKVIYGRRSVRNFLNKPVTKEQIMQVIDAGRMAPSAMNKQPWKFYVLTHKDTIHLFSREIAVAVTRDITHMPFMNLIKTAKDMLEFPHGLDLMESGDMIFHNAPVVIFITSNKEDEWGALDIGMCAENMMLAAKAMGLDTCPVGFGKFVDKTKSYPLLNISQKEKVDLAMILGYGGENPLMHDRKKNNVVFID